MDLFSYICCLSHYLHLISTCIIPFISWVSHFGWYFDPHLCYLGIARSLLKIDLLLISGLGSSSLLGFVLGLGSHIPSLFYFAAFYQLS
jgi:hypothetical protein